MRVGADPRGYGCPVSTTEILFLNGQRFEVDGEPKTVEATTVAAARGSMMALAWLNESTTGTPIAVNANHVLALRDAATE
jgi:hypothetical protein